MENRNPEKPTPDGVDAASPWSGLAEVSEAIRDNRLMEYRIKKSWADPWARSLTIAVLARLIHRVRSEGLAGVV